MLNNSFRTARVAACSAAFWIMTVAGTACMLPLAGCDDAEARTGANLTADRAMARKQSFEITTVASGQLEAKDDLEIRSKVESRTSIVELVKEGTKVKAGDVLLVLSADQIDKQIIDETARVQSSRSDLVSAENAVAIQEIDNESRLRKAKLKRDLTRVTLEQWKEGDVAIKRLSLSLDLEKADRELNRAKDRLERSEKLFAREFLSSEELEKDRIAVIEWTKALEKAQKNIEVYNSYEYPKDEQTKLGDVADAEAELQRVELNNEKELAVKKADLENKKQQLRLREENLAKLNQQKENTVVKAPRDGLVVYATSMERGRFQDGSLQVGKEVTNNEQLMSLPDTSEMVASVKVHESLAGRIRAGMPASIKVEAAGGKLYRGVVESIGVLAESNGWRDPNLREYTVRVHIDKDEDTSLLKPSMRAEAQIILGRVTDSIAVPVQAVFNDGAVRFVYTADGSKFRRVPVKVGRRSDTMAEISAGLPESTAVLLREPTPGEVINTGWELNALKATGYKLDENGQPIAEEEAMPMTPRMPGEAGPRSRPEGGGGGGGGAGGGGRNRQNRGPAGAQPGGAPSGGPSTGSTPSGTPPTAPSPGSTSPAANPPAGGAPAPKPTL
ncbi:MAG: HlyD family efflux transporter periplasmic adaptor subunit [Planctomycetes bacterium]|nr:HlyD family efflux transporter periplasmic adaptor subunit [Planctomycetota bacterium]